MELNEVTQIVFEEIQRLESVDRLLSLADTGFESVDDCLIPVDIMHEVEKQMFFSDGPEVTTPADEFRFYM